MVAFLVIEPRSRSRSFRSPSSGSARRRVRTSSGFGLGRIVFGMFFLLSLYMQQMLGFSALKTGLGISRGGADRGRRVGRRTGARTRIGVKPVLATALRLIGAGLVVFTQISVDGTYVGRSPARLPAHRRRPRLLVRAGLDCRARRDRAQGGGPRVGADQHLAADRRSARRRDPDDRVHDPQDEPDRGRRAAAGCVRQRVSAAFWVAAAFAAISIVATLVLLRRSDLQQATAGAPVG